MSFMKKVISISNTYSGTHWQANVNEALDTISESVQRANGVFPPNLVDTPGLLFASMTNVIHPESHFRTWLESVAFDRGNDIDTFVNTVTTSPFWDSPQFVKAQWPRARHMDTNEATVLDFAIIAYLCGRIDSDTFESVKQVFYAKCEFEKGKPAIQYYEKKHPTIMSYAPMMTHKNRHLLTV